MQTVQQLLDSCNQIAPFDTACGFDHVGLLVGEGCMPCQKIGVALDVTPTVLSLAKQQGCTAIVTHHPVIFNPLATLEPHQMPYQLAKADIACIAMHTNLDKVAFGVNDCVATTIGMTEIQSPAGCEDLARLGKLSTPQEMEVFIDHLKVAFDAPMIRYYDAGKPISHILSVAGSGGDLLETALTLGADTLITGDLKQDRYVEAQCRGINLIELTHQDAERTVLPWLAKQLTLAGFDAVVLPPATIHAR